MSLLCDDLLEVRPISVRASDLVMVRHYLEASEGLGFLIAKKGGNALLVTPKSQSADLDEFIDDMKAEFALVDGDASVRDEVSDVAL